MSKQDIFDPSFTEDASAYRVKVMVKNNLLLSAIEAAGYKSVAAFSKEVGWTTKQGWGALLVCGRLH
jgi:hypothetical protein